MVLAGCMITVGLALALLRSMVDRGLGVNWVANNAYHDWERIDDRSNFGRLLAFLAGFPAVCAYVLLAITTHGWWTLLVVPAAVPIAMLIVHLASGKNVVAAGYRIHRLGLWLPILTILMIPVAAVACGHAERVAANENGD